MRLGGLGEEERPRVPGASGISASTSVRSELFEPLDVGVGCVVLRQRGAADRRRPAENADA